MEYGKWELRDDSVYYFSKDAMIYPSSNALDEGKLNTEENIRNIYRDLTRKNFVTAYNYFSLKINANRNGIIISPGEAVVQGYHFYTKNSIDIKVPNNTIKKENGDLDYGPVIQYTLGLSLTYDAANHVTGDVVNKEGDVGESETLSGVYIKWFNECELECNYDNILVLGRAWVHKGSIVGDGLCLDDEDNPIENNSDKTIKRVIYHGFEPDPFKDHKFEADTVEVQVHGHQVTDFDTLRDNMTQIHDSLYTYDSMHFPIELNRQLRTKPPTHTTDIQDYVNHIPDWYVSKYGDYMTGALRFNNLSIDAIRELNKELNKEDSILSENDKLTKDSIHSKFRDSVIISPRTYRDLLRADKSSVKNKDYNYNVGGTIMSIVPTSYRNGINYNNGLTGIHSALISQQNGETGLRIHCGNGDENDENCYTRLVQYSISDNGDSASGAYNQYRNTSKFIIENTDETGRQSSINMKHGEIFIDSFVSPLITPEEEDRFTNNDFNGISYRSGIQLYTSSESGLNGATDRARNIDFRVDEYEISVANHTWNNHRTGERGINHNGKINDDLHFKMGVGIGYDAHINSFSYETSGYNIDNYIPGGINENNKSVTDPYLYLGNIRIRSNSIDNYSVKQNTIEIFNYGKNKNNLPELPYIRIKPRVYSEQYLAESMLQIGTSKYDDYAHNNAQDATLSKIVMKKYIDSGINSDYITCFEQDYNNNNNSEVYNKMMPAVVDNKTSNKAPMYNEIAGIYSFGNIGCSNASLGAVKTGHMGGYNAYNDGNEWVRFTRFRYDLDKDQVNGGTNTTAHENGRTWGDTYNLEFNTTIANRRANQIIWKFNGSKGSQDANTLANTPPVILSYIHDTTVDSNQSTPTKYTNTGKGTFETYYDHAGNTHYNPTNKIRDFLLLENAGLSISGDINNPSWCGDTLNVNNHLGVTIVQGRVYNAVYNDFAETFEKNNKEEIAKPGTLISLNANTGKYEITNKFEDKLVVGVVSNTYAFLAGGNRINNTQDIIELENEYFTVALCGKVWVNVIKNSNIKPGDMLVSSLEKGKATTTLYDTPGTVVGKALSEPKYFEEEDEYKVLMLVITR